MKKLLAMLLCSAMALATIGCGGTSGGAAAGSKPEADSTAAVESAAAVESTAAVESEPAEEAEPAADGGVLMMATTTSTEDTGLLDYLQPLFKEATGIDLQWTAVGTGEALKLGEDGQVDIVLVHAKASEEEFVANGFGVERFPVMYNDFVIVGPAEPIAKTDDVAADSERSRSSSSHLYPAAMIPARTRRKRRSGQALNLIRQPIRITWNPARAWALRSQWPMRRTLTA